VYDPFPPLDPVPAEPHQWDVCPKCKGHDLTWRLYGGPNAPDDVLATRQAPGYTCEDCGHYVPWPGGAP
jgi:hypothetical protein